MSNVFVGRQPIFDQKLNVYGYELLYRAAEADKTSAGMVSGEQATSTTIINTFVVGLEVVGLRQRRGVRRDRSGPVGA